MFASRHIARNGYDWVGQSQSTIWSPLTSNSLWDVLGEGEVRHIADFAAEHFKKHGKPLRVAVDEACWRYTNLTPEEVEKIRQGEPAANPVEKTILWR